MKLDESDCGPPIELVPARPGVPEAPWSAECVQCAVYGLVTGAHCLINVAKLGLSAGAQGDMSVFGDFQRVWVERFPDSALPAAWEEDVRANLVKHKLKVDSLSSLALFIIVLLIERREYRLIRSLGISRGQRMDARLGFFVR